MNDGVGFVLLVLMFAGQISTVILYSYGPQLERRSRAALVRRAASVRTAARRRAEQVAVRNAQKARRARWAAEWSACCARWAAKFNAHRDQRKADRAARRAQQD